MSNCKCDGHPRINISHTGCHRGADAFWQYWNENGETHKHGYYESTWGAINAALKLVGVYSGPCSRHQEKMEDDICPHCNHKKECHGYGVLVDSSLVIGEIERA